MGDVAGVTGGNLEGVEHGGSAFWVDAILTEHGKDHGEGELNGVGIFEWGGFEVDGAAGVAVVLGEEGLATDVIEIVAADWGGGCCWGAGVVVAERLAAERGGLAAAAAGADVPAVGGGHAFLLG